MKKLDKDIQDLIDQITAMMSKIIYQNEFYKYILIGHVEGSIK